MTGPSESTAAGAGAEAKKPYGAPRYAKMRRYLLEGIVVVAAVTAVLWWSARSLVDAGSAAPALSGKTWRGEAFTLSSSADDAARTLVYFYAPWCGVCKVSAVNAATAARWLGEERLKVVAVALDYETEESAVAFAAERGLTTQQGVEVVLANEATRDAWHVTAFPTYYVVTADGLVRHGTVGYSTLPGMLVRALF